MGISKTDIFTNEQNSMAQIAKALGHPARIAIVEFLLQQKSCICKDIVEEIPLAQPTISQHLRELKKVGLIKGNIEGNSVCYCLNSEPFKLLANYYQHILYSIQPMDDNCCSEKEKS